MNSKATSQSPPGRDGLDLSSVKRPVASAPERSLVESSCLFPLPRDMPGQSSRGFGGGRTRCQASLRSLRVRFTLPSRLPVQSVASSLNHLQHLQPLVVLEPLVGFELFFEYKATDAEPPMSRSPKTSTVSACLPQATNGLLEVKAVAACLYGGRHVSRLPRRFRKKFQDAP